MILLNSEVDNSLIFLDLTTKIDGDKLDFCIYRKPTTFDLIIPNDSSQSCNIQMITFHGLVHRLLSVSFSKDNYRMELQIIKNIANNNGHNPSINGRLINKEQKRKVLILLYTEPSALFPTNTFIYNSTIILTTT